MSVRGRLSLLLAGDLDFRKASRDQSWQELQSFAAKFPPELPRAFIQGLTRPGDVVLDPMAGSGTTVVEALLAGRRAVGVDLDPLAVLLMRVKLVPSEADGAVRWEHTSSALGDRLVAEATERLREPQCLDALLAQRFDAETKAFLDYWFLPETQRELLALRLSIERLEHPLARQFALVALSGTIVTKSGGVSLARDLAHSRPHRDATKRPRSALELFAMRFRKNVETVRRLGQRAFRGNALAVVGDARALPLADDSVDIIVTSPPYANALDYMRAHKFALVWLGMPIRRLTRLRSRYIGAERVASGGSTPRDVGALPEATAAVVREVAERDSRRARVLERYFVEMRAALAEMHRVLRKGRVAVVVVGPSQMRGVSIRTHACLAELAEAVGFAVVAVAQRRLDRDRRMLPVRADRAGDFPIERRIHEEYVVGLVKER